MKYVYLKSAMRKIMTMAAKWAGIFYLKAKFYCFALFSNNCINSVSTELLVGFFTAMEPGVGIQLNFKYFNTVESHFEPGSALLNA